MQLSAAVADLAGENLARGQDAANAHACEEAAWRMVKQYTFSSPEDKLDLMYRAEHYCTRLVRGSKAMPQSAAVMTDQLGHTMQGERRPTGESYTDLLLEYLRKQGADHALLGETPGCARVYNRITSMHATHHPNLCIWIH